MNIRAKLAPEHQLTIEEFLAFTATRTKGERWELIEGAAVLNPSPVDWHQVVVSSITQQLMNWKQRTGAPWLPMIGTGTRVPASERSLPQPDVMVKELEPTGSPVTDDAVVIFEVWSKSNTKADQAWRKRVYSSVPNCQHYVTVSMKKVEVTLYNRSSDWDAHVLTHLKDKVVLPAIGVSIPLSDIYRYTPLGMQP